MTVLTRLATGAGNVSVTVGASVPANSGCILAMVYWFPIPGTFTLSDNVNGPYTLVRSWQFPSGVTQLGLFSVQANTTGTPTISASATDAGEIFYIAYSGLLGTLTFPSLDNSNATATGTAVNSGSFNCSVNNEFAIGIYNGSSVTPNFTANSPFSTNVDNNASGHSGLWDTIFNFGSGMSAGTPVSLVGTNASDTWDAWVFGFYDNTTPSAIVPPGAKQTFVNTEYIQY
jgi:hypothetical protein